MKALLRLTLALAAFALAAFSSRANTQTIGTAGHFLTVEAPAAGAVTRVWDGGGAPDGRWLRTSNWVDEVVPTANQTLQFPATALGGLARQATNDFPAGTAFHQLRFEGSDWRLSGNGLFLLSGLSASNTLPNAPELSTPLTLLAPQSIVHSGLNALSMGILAPVNLDHHTLRIEGDSPVLIRGPISGSGGLVMANASRLDFSLVITQAFTGGLVISNGLVNAANYNAPGVPWTVRDGTLQLIGGSIPGLVATGGRVIVAAAEEVLGDVTLASGLTLAVALNVGELRIHGQVQLGGASLELLPGGLGTVPGDVLIVIDNDGPAAITGTFANVPEGGILSGPGVNGTGALFRISYRGGDGNDVTLTRLAAPATHVTSRWDGGGVNGFWNDGANWAGDRTPGPGDDLLFPAEAERRANTNTLFAFGFSANSIEFEGNGYTIGVLPLSNLLGLNHGVISRNADGTNTLALPIVVPTTQSFQVEGANATLVLDGTRVPGNVIARGLGIVSKTGEGALELKNGIVRAADGFELIRGQLRLNNALIEGTLTASHGVLEIVEGEVEELVAESAIIRLRRTHQVFTTLAVSNATFDAASTLQLHLTEVGGILPPGVALELSESGVAELGHATLALQLDADSSFGDRIVVLHNLGTNAVIGTFAELPEGGVLVAGGRRWRITYAGAPTGRDIVLTAEEAVIALTDLVRSAGDAVILAGTAEPSRVFIVEASSDFVSFTVVGSTTANPTGAWRFIDNTASALPHRFYRARYQ